jgi:hypothetical protein
VGGRDSKKTNNQQPFMWTVDTQKRNRCEAVDQAFFSTTEPSSSAQQQQQQALTRVDKLTRRKICRESSVAWWSCLLRRAAVAAATQCLVRTRIPARHEQVSQWQLRQHKVPATRKEASQSTRRLQSVVNGVTAERNGPWLGLVRELALFRTVAASVCWEYTVS